MWKMSNSVDPDEAAHYELFAKAYNNRLWQWELIPYHFWVINVIWSNRFKPIYAEWTLKPYSLYRSIYSGRVFDRNSCPKCNQCRPWSDAAICGVWSDLGLHCLLLHKLVCVKSYKTQQYWKGYNSYEQGVAGLAGIVLGRERFIRDECCPELDSNPWFLEQPVVTDTRAQREKMHFVTYASNEDSNQPAHLHRLISIRCPQNKHRDFTLLAIQNAPSNDSDHDARTRKLIWTFNGRTCPKICFLTLWRTTFKVSGSAYRGV